MAHITVDVDLDDFDDEDLINHLKNKGYRIDDEIVDMEYELRGIAEDIKYGKDYTKKLYDLIYNQTGLIL